MKKVTTKFLKENILAADVISKKRDGSGNFIFRKSFYYKFGNNKHTFADKISGELTEMGIKHEVIDKGEKYVVFRGGSSVAQGSHWWVTVKVNQEV